MNLKSNKRNEEVLNINNEFFSLLYLNNYLLFRLLDTQKNLKMFGCILKKLSIC